MGAVGTVTRDPGVVALNITSGLTTSPILRGQTVTVDQASFLARLPAATTEHIMGVATSDADTDINQVAVATRGGYTVQIKPSTGITFTTGQLVYVDETNYGGFTNVAGTGFAASPVGFCIDNRLDAQGNVEMGFLVV